MARSVAIGRLFEFYGLSQMEFGIHFRARYTVLFFASWSGSKYNEQMFSVVYSGISVGVFAGVFWCKICWENIKSLICWSIWPTITAGP